VSLEGPGAAASSLHAAKQASEDRRRTADVVMCRERLRREEVMGFDRSAPLHGTRRTKVTTARRAARAAAA
jgi:hypothetical protein